MKILEKLQFKKENDVALGLDIGKDSVKLVQLKREGEIIKLTKLDLLKLPASKSFSLTQTQVVKKLISEFLLENKIEQKNVILGIGAQSVFLKFLEILPVSTESLQKTIKYEAQQQIPFALEEVEWDAHLFEPKQKEEPSSYNVLLVAIKKDRLLSKMSLIEQLGLRPSILDVTILGIYNCINFNQDYDENKLTLVLDIGAQSTDLLILQEDKLWMRGLAIGGDNITDALEKKFNISFADAQRLKQSSNLDSPRIKEVVRSVLEDLRGEITRSVEYYHFQQSQKGLQEAKEGSSESATRIQIEQILLSGGTSLMQGLDRFLSESFSCPVRNLEPFKMLQVDEGIKAKINSQSKALFSPAVGLALRGLAKSFININLLKEQIKTKKLLHQRLAYAVGAVILAVVILFGASTFMRQDYRDKNLRLRYLRGLLDSFSTYLPQIKELQKEEKFFSQQIETLGNLAANRALWLRILMELQRMLPDEVWITQFSGSISSGVSLDEDFQSILDLHGKAVSYEGVNDFVARLKSCTLFTEVKPLSSAFVEEKAVDQEKVEVVKFSISMKVVPLEVGSKWVLLQTTKD